MAFNRSLPRTDRFYDRPDLGEITNVAAPIVVPISNVIECAGCGVRITVGKNVVMAYCGDCSAKSTGKKR